ncbi:helicase SNF2 [Variovorax sp. J22R115]|uniref:helicase SNF2 n=1 Tax=Variovorax sp. J22R115 TaxID=3053509 RepID=UPI0025762F0F|nr:helicase SNF2 [Variovorax sp. J22R115]MDM0049834.1 helicase SNF2 [Variovorax sp. J22R115]
MKLSFVIGATALSSLCAMSASAEQYQGVLKFKSNADRDEVRSQALAAAHAADPFREGAHSGVAPAFRGQADKETVRSLALGATRAGNPYGEGAGVARVTGTSLDRQAVRAEAGATAARCVIESTQ